MVQARPAFLAVTLLALLLPSAVLSGELCKEDVVSQSGLFGTKHSNAVHTDHSSLMDKGRITRVSLYFSKKAGCLRGIKVAFGTPPTPGVIGSTADTSERFLKLTDGEFFKKAEVKANKCIKYVKLSTNKGRYVEAGQPDAAPALVASGPKDGEGQLVAIKGFQGPGEGKRSGSLQQLQFVWGSLKCVSAGASATDASSIGVAVAESGTLQDSPAATTTTTAAELVAADPGSCRPRTDMCNEKASMNAFTYCIWNAPFTASACKGGCCFSSGKCASSSCAISGMGRDVANMICYGVNSGVGLGGNSFCSGLACKLATPGCSTDAIGGNCVGTVVPFPNREAVHPESARLIGAPCLDATPSDTTLNAEGNIASGSDGIFMGRLWTICDCLDGGHGLPEPAARLLNLTTTRISNFTKNEVLAAFSTLLPQKNSTEELDGEGKPKVVTLLPSFADVFKVPSLSSINLSGFLGNMTAFTASNSNGSVPFPKLPNLQGLLEHVKPQTDVFEASYATQPMLNLESGSLPNGTSETALVETQGKKPGLNLGNLVSRLVKPKDPAGSAAAGSSSSKTAATQGQRAGLQSVQDNPSDTDQPVLNFESGSLPNGTAGEFTMVDSPAEKPARPPNTLGSLLSRFTKSKDPAANSDGSSTFTPGASSAAGDGSNSGSSSSGSGGGGSPVKLKDVANLLGALRKAGPAAQTPGASAPGGATAAGDSAAVGTASDTAGTTKKPDYSAIGALVKKFIAGPQANPATNATANGTAPATAPAAAESQLAGSNQTVAATGNATSASQGDAAAAGATSPPNSNATSSNSTYIPGDPKNRPPTLAERLKQKRLEMEQAKAAETAAATPAANSSSTAASASITTPAHAAAAQPESQPTVAGSSHSPFSNGPRNVDYSYLGSPAAAAAPQPQEKPQPQQQQQPPQQQQQQQQQQQPPQQQQQATSPNGNAGAATSPAPLPASSATTVPAVAASQASSASNATNLTNDSSPSTSNNNSTSGHIPGDPKDRPPTLGERLRNAEQDKAQEAAATNSSSANPTAGSAATSGPAGSAPTGNSSTAAAEQPAPQPSFRKRGFSHNPIAVDYSYIGFPTPDQITQQLQQDEALLQQLQQQQQESAAAGGTAQPVPDIAALTDLVDQLSKASSAEGGAAAANLPDLSAISALLAQLNQGAGSSSSSSSSGPPADVAAMLAKLAADVNKAADARGAPGTSNTPDVSKKDAGAAADARGAPPTSNAPDVSKKDDGAAKAGGQDMAGKAEAVNATGNGTAAPAKPAAAAKQA